MSAMRTLNKKAQAALEFLTTYAWAFVVILVTMGALYYFGIFDFSRYVPEKCTFTPQFACADFSIRASSISAKMANTLGEPINITSLELTNDATPPMICTSPITPPTHLGWPSGIALDLNFTSCSGGGLIAGERIDGRLRMVYFAVNSPSKTPHSVQGKISGQVLR